MQEETIREAKQKRSRPLPALLQTVSLERFKFHPKKQTEYFLGIFYPASANTILHTNQ